MFEVGYSKTQHSWYVLYGSSIQFYPEWWIAMTAALRVEEIEYRSAD